MVERKSTAVIKTLDPAVANVAGSNSNQKALRGISARIIEVKKSDDSTVPGKSTSLPDDPFEALTKEGKVVEPPFDLLTLAMLTEHNTIMGQCVEAMEQNIDGFGYRFVPRLKLLFNDNQVPKKEKKECELERVRLENFFMYATRESFTKFRKKIRKDLETTGNGYFEVIRGQKNEIQAFVHIPSYQMRIGRAQDEQRLVDRKILEMQSDGKIIISTIKEWRRFRLYAQSKSIHRRNMVIVGGPKVRWFKEFGDPVVYDNRTGEAAKKKLKPEHQANEIVHFSIYSTRSAYGLPRYIGNLLSIFGDRASEEINFITFRNNNIPSMVVAVSNGQLTEGTVQRIESFVESQIQGSDNYSKFLILEAETDFEGDDGSQIKMEIKPLTKEQHSDALFQNYSGNNKDNVRQAWRLPPIFIGKTEDYTRTTAESSRRLADEQIFAPERDEFDAFFNRIIFPEMGIVYNKFKSNSPNTTDNQELVKILAGAEKTGGMTPRIARMMLEDILGAELPPFPEEFPADIPFSLTMAEAVKNQADASEPGQQVTAMKILKQLGFWPDEGSSDETELFDAECSKCGNTELVSNLDKSGDPVVDHLLRINKKYEQELRRQALDSEFDEE